MRRMPFREVAARVRHPCGAARPHVGRAHPVPYQPAVISADGNGRRPVRLELLGAIRQDRRDLIALRQPRGKERVGEPVHARVELAEREPVVLEHQPEVIRAVARCRETKVPMCMSVPSLLIRSRRATTQDA